MCVVHVSHHTINFIINYVTHYETLQPSIIFDNSLFFNKGYNFYLRKWLCNICHFQ